MRRAWVGFTLLAGACAAAASVAAAPTHASFKCTALDRTIGASPKVLQDLRALKQAQLAGSTSEEQKAETALSGDVKGWTKNAGTVADWLFVAQTAQGTGDEQLAEQAFANAEAVGIADEEFAYPTQFGGKTAGLGGGQCLGRIGQALKKLPSAPSVACSNLPAASALGGAVAQNVAQARKQAGQDLDLDCFYLDAAKTQKYGIPTGIEVSGTFQEPDLTAETVAKLFIAAYNPENYAPIGDLGQKNVKAWGFYEELPHNIRACGVFAWLPYSSFILTGQGTLAGCEAGAKLVLAVFEHDRSASKIPVVYPPLPVSPGMGS